MNCMLIHIGVNIIGSMNVKTIAGQLPTSIFARSASLIVNVTRSTLFNNELVFIQIHEILPGQTLWKYCPAIVTPLAAKKIFMTF